jgi:copper transport outer membrane protein MctB
MGYSARYHLASLAAVFLALAIGILIGSEFGDEIVSDTRANLENSLTDNLEEAQDRADDLRRDLELSDAFAEGIYPTLVGDRLAERSIGVLALGDISEDLAAEIENALEPTGGSLIAVGVIREPPDLSELAIDLEDTRFSDVDENLDTVQALGTGVGRRLAIGGTLLDVVQPDLFSSTSGTFGALDGVIVVRDQPGDLDDEDAAATNRLEAGLIDGLQATGATVVGVETSGDDDSSVPFFQSAGIANVDDLDLVAGRVAMVFSLLGARGSFGVNETADRLLPDLLAPVIPRRPGPGSPPPPRADQAPPGTPNVAPQQPAGR